MIHTVATITYKNFNFDVDVLWDSEFLLGINSGYWSHDDKSLEYYKITIGFMWIQFEFSWTRPNEHFLDEN